MTITLTPPFHGHVDMRECKSAKPVYERRHPFCIESRERRPYLGASGRDVRDMQSARSRVRQVQAHIRARRAS